MFTTPATNCDFKLKGGTAFYYGGDSLAGTVTLNIFKRLQLESVELSLIGASHVLWHEKTPLEYIEHNDCMRLDEDCTKYEARREFLNLQQSISQAIVFENDRISSDFEFELPIDLPATYRDEIGEVSYELQLILRRRTKFDLVFKREIFIKRRLDLNKIPELDEFSSAAFVSGDNEITLQLPYAGFVPGQLISYSLQIENVLAMPNIVISLCQVVKYRDEQPAARVKAVKMLLDYRQACNANGFLRIPLTMPITTAPHDSGNLIEIAYYVEAVILTVDQQVEKRLQIPIVIGTKKLSVAQLTSQGDLEVEPQLYCYDNYAVKKATPAISWALHYERMCMAQAEEPKENDWQRYRKRNFVLPLRSVWQILYNDLFMNFNR